MSFQEYTFEMYGYADQENNETWPAGLLPARVTEVRRERYHIVCDLGERTAVLKGSYLHAVKQRDQFPAVGDYVLVRVNDQGTSQIVQLLPRKSKFSRSDFSGHAAGYVKTIVEQVVAANFDYVFIMSSLNNDFNPTRIARYVSQAIKSGGTPVILLTKADLCDHCAVQMEAVSRIAKGIAVLPLSSYTGFGLDALTAYLQPGKTIVFLGSSGVGKSSLLNALAGQDLMAVSAVREGDSRGRHTTTHRQLVRLPSGALIIDTPGMRELGLWDADEGIHAVFSDIESIIAQCRFSDCSHTSEPGCAVLAALAEGSLTREKWDIYLAQTRESAFVNRRSKKKR